MSHTQQLIETIQTGIATEATPEARQQAAAACRQILAALETTPGQPLGPGPSYPAAGSRPPGVPQALDPTLVLDAVIAKLRTLVPDDQQAGPAPHAGLQIPLVSVPPRPQ
jgi:hypothetical protein